MMMKKSDELHSAYITPTPASPLTLAAHIYGRERICLHHAQHGRAIQPLHCCFVRVIRYVELL